MEPTNLYRPGGFIGSIAWELDLGKALAEMESTEIDTSVIKGSQVVEDGQLVYCDDSFKSTGKLTYDCNADILLETTADNYDSAIDLTKGVYLLLRNDEAVGVLVKNIKKIYDSLADEVD